MIAGLLAVGDAAAQTTPPTAAASIGVAPVVITAERPAVVTSIDRTSYAVGQDLQSQNGSVADVLRGIPLVDVDIDGNPSLRGDSGVQVMINGRPSPMLSGADRGAVLQMLAAAGVDSIEVITNPSAAFRPDGTAGVINIVTKKTYRPGPTGIVRANMGSEGRYNVGANGGYGLGWASFYGGLTFRQDSRKRDSETLRADLDPASGQTATSDQDVTSNILRRSIGGYGGVSLELDKADTLDLDLAGHLRQGAPRSLEHDLANTPADDHTRAGDGFENGDDLDLSAKYKHSFAGDTHELTLDAEVSRSTDDDDHVYRNRYRVPAGPDTADDQTFRGLERQVQFSAEYKRPLPGEARLDVGYTLQHDDDLYFNGADTIDPLSGAATPNLAQTNTFAFTQTIQALFATYQRPLGKLTGQAGLRLEQVNLDTDQQTKGLKASSGYTRVYPTLHLDYPLTATQTLKASYGLRINRPRPDDYNPFVVVNDPFNESAGNPRLTPQQTHAVELTWQDIQPQQSRTVTAYFRQTEDALTDVSRSVSDTVLLSTKANLGRIRSTGFDFSQTGKPSARFNYTINGYVFDNQVAEANEGFTGVRSDFSYSVKASLNWRPTAKDQLQLSGDYSARRLYPQGYRTPGAGADLGYRHDILANLAVVATVSDLFASRGDRTAVDTPLVHDAAIRRVMGRTAYLGLTWRLSGFRRPGDQRIGF